MGDFTTCFSFSFSSSFSFGLGLDTGACFSPLPVPTIVCSPDERNIPPPAREGLVDCRVCWSSLNVCVGADGAVLGEGEGEAAAGGVGRVVRGREESGFSKSSEGDVGVGVFLVLGLTIVLDGPALGSTISIGILRRLVLGGGEIMSIGVF